MRQRQPSPAKRAQQPVIQSPETRCAPTARPFQTINEDINAGRYMPGMGAVAAALEAAGPAAAPGGPGAAGGFAATGFNLPPIGPADFAAGGPWGGLAAALGPNGLAPSGQLARPGAQPSPDRQAGGLLNGWPLPQVCCAVCMLLLLHPTSSPGGFYYGLSHVLAAYLAAHAT